MEKTSLEQAFKKLYDSEINFGLQSFWDGGFQVWIGDETNGIKAAKNFEINEFEEAAEWLLSYD